MSGAVLPADVLAMMDVLSEVGEESDSLQVEAALELHRAVQRLAAKCREVTQLLESQIVAVLESPRIFDGVEYAVVSDGKWRPDQAAVRGRVVNAAAVDVETGEVFSGRAAAERAVMLMSKLYVSPSTMPKVGGLEELSASKEDVASFEATGLKVRTIPVVQQ